MASLSQANSTNTATNGAGSSSTGTNNSTTASNNENAASEGSRSVYMVKKIFYKFCNEKNYLTFQEFKRLDEATEEGKSQLTEESFAQLCHYLMVEDSVRGLDINQFSLIYLNESASVALGTDLNSDFSTLFPDEAKVALIFDTYDVNQDGRLCEAEFIEFAKSVKNATVAMNKDFQNEVKELYVKLGSILKFEVTSGMSLKHLIDLYLSDAEDVLNFCSRCGFNMDSLDKNAEDAAEKIGLS